jgi:membrane protein YqaA with SNARE-associated domain
MDTGSLSEYVVGRVKAGVVKAEIKEELLAVGWSEEEADAAYRDGVIALGIPVPNEGNRPTLSKKSSTADVVVNLFSFILLGIVATALGVLWFNVIGKFFPDPLPMMGYYAESAATSAIHYSIAALLIGFPLYYAAMRIWFRKFREDEGRTESKLSKWLTYLVLLAASVTIVGDLITVVFTFLQGEITVRFFLKALTILAIAGIIFGFYFLERKKIQYRKDIPGTVFRNFGIAVAAFVALGIAFGFFAGGSPETARKMSFDMQRTNDLSSLSSCIENYATDLGMLPGSLAELKKSSMYSYCADSMQDPETKKEYGYRIVAPSRMQGAARVGEFELCATFALPSSDRSGQVAPFGGDIWSEHGAGLECDTATVQLGTLAPTAPAGGMGYPIPTPIE